MTPKIELTEEQLAEAARVLKARRTSKGKVAYAVSYSANMYRILLVKFPDGRKIIEVRHTENICDKFEVCWRAQVHFADIDKFMPDATSHSRVRPEMRGNNYVFSTLNAAREAASILRQRDIHILLVEKNNAQARLDEATSCHAESLAPLEADLAEIATMDAVGGGS